MKSEPTGVIQIEGEETARQPIFMHPVIFMAGWLLLGGLFGFQDYVMARSWNYHPHFALQHPNAETLLELCGYYHPEDK